jgi:hypothetical protein
MAKGKTFKGFSDEQMKRIAGKLGFQGPVENFGQFLQSNPAMAAKYAGLEAKARMKFQVGGHGSCWTTTGGYCNKQRYPTNNAR